MTGHRCVIEAGPGVIRRLCCGAADVVDTEAAGAAVDGIDDPIALVDGQPVAVDALWAAVLRSLACPDRPSAPESVLVVHPSWWSGRRVELVTAAARGLAGDVVAWSRARLLAGAAPDDPAPVVVEIAERLVAISTAGTVAEPRCGTAEEVAEAVLRRVGAATRGAGATVLIDGPPGVGGAEALAEAIAERAGATLAGVCIHPVDDARLVRLAAATEPAAAGPGPAVTRGGRSRAALSAAVIVAAVVVLVVLGGPVRGRQAARQVVAVTEAAPTTFLVEGRVALQVPAQWPVRRVTAGPGSARVEVISPSDPQVMLHVTQSPVPGGTQQAAAEALHHAVQQANAEEPTQVFVDFDPSGQRAGRPAVTYREVREGHRIDWTVLLDGAVRISIGCQSRTDDAEAVREVCDQAVRSARAVG